MNVTQAQVLAHAKFLAPNNKLADVPAHTRVGFADTVAKQLGVNIQEVRALLVDAWSNANMMGEVSAADHRVMAGTPQSPTFGGTRSGGWQAQLATRTAAPPNTIVKDDRLYGYKLGPTENDTRERVVAKLLTGGTVMTLEAAAFDKAVVPVKAHFQHTNLEFRFGLQKGTGLIGDGPDVAFEPGRAVHEAAGEDAPKHRFESLYGNFTRVFTTTYLTKMKGRAPTADELGQEMRAIFAKSKVDVGVYLQQLARSPDAADNDLARALTA